MLTRRSFLKFLGLVGFYALTPLRRFFPHFPLEASYLQTGELFADLLLLPNGAILPSFVQYPKLPMPRLCGVDAVGEKKTPDAVVHFFENHEEVAQKMTFPVYLLSPLPEGLRQGKAFSISLDSGELHSLSLSYEAFNKDSQWWGNVASFWIFVQYPRPFPLWTVEPLKEDDPSVWYEKIDFLPTPGIKVQSQEGFVFYWVKEDILYTFTLEPCTSEEVARNLINLFVPL